MASESLRSAARPLQGRKGRAAGYLRRSTDRQEQSIPDQRRAVERYALEQGLELEHLYVDDAISGTSALRRPGFQQMVADAQRPGSFGTILVYDVKRFGRLDNDEAGYWRHILRQSGVKIRYITEGFNGDGTDDLLRPVKQWQAREESKDLSRVTIRGLLSRVEGGFWMGGAPPYGYDLRYERPDGGFLLLLRFQPDGSKDVLDEQGAPVRHLERGESMQLSGRDRARLWPSESGRIEVVRRVFRLCAEENRGLRTIADLLNGEGHASPRGPGWARIYSGTWTASTVRSILMNPQYAGDLVWNRRTDARFFRIEGGRATERRDAFGARLVPNPEEDWIVVRDAHPALVPRPLFEAAQKSRKVRSKKHGGGRVVGGWKGQRARFLLSGLVWCGRCGGRYEGVSRTKGKRRRDGSVVKTHSYLCSSYVRKGRSGCEPGSLLQRVLEGAVVQAIVAAYQGFRGEEGGHRLAQAVRSLSGHEVLEVADAKTRGQETLEELAAKVARLLDNITPTNRAFVDERLAELDREKRGVEQRLEELERLAWQDQEIAMLISEVGAFLHQLSWTLESGSPEERIRAVRRCVERVVVSKDRSVELELRLVPAAIGDERNRHRITVPLRPRTP